MKERKKRGPTRWTDTRETPIWENPCLRPDHNRAQICDGYCMDKLVEEKNVGDYVALTPTLGCTSNADNVVKDWEKQKCVGKVIYKNEEHYYYTVDFGKFKESYHYYNYDHSCKPVDDKEN